MEINPDHISPLATPEHALCPSCGSRATSAHKSPVDSSSIIIDFECGGQGAYADMGEMFPPVLKMTTLPCPQPRR